MAQAHSQGHCEHLYPLHCALVSLSCRRVNLTYFPLSLSIWEKLQQPINIQIHVWSSIKVRIKPCLLRNSRGLERSMEGLSAYFGWKGSHERHFWLTSGRRHEAQWKSKRQDFDAYSSITESFHLSWRLNLPIVLVQSQKPTRPPFLANELQCLRLEDLSLLSTSCQVSQPVPPHHLVLWHCTSVTSSRVLPSHDDFISAPHHRHH